MELLKVFKEKQKNIDSNYIDICTLLNTIRKQEFESLSNIAIAIKLSKIHQKIKTYTKTEEFEMQLNSSEIFVTFLDELIDYDKGYIANITKETFNRYHNIYIKKNELSEIEELSKTNDKLSKEEQELELEQKKIKDVIHLIDYLNSSMLSLHNSPYLSPFEVACVIANKNLPEMQEKIGAYDICEEWEFLSAIKYVSEKLEKGMLTISQEFLGIPSIQVKAVLYNDGRIIKGFNDYFLNRVAEEYEDMTITISQDNFAKTDSIKLPAFEIDDKNIEDITLTLRAMFELENEITQLKEQLAQAQQVTPTPASEEEKLLDELDPRTKNNFIRVMIALNELAINKQGNHLHIGEKFSSDNLDKINIEMEKLGYQPIGERGYKTLMDMINKLR